MSQTPYQRVDLDKLESASPAAAQVPVAQLSNVDDPRDTSVRWIILPVSILLCVAQAVINILAENVQQISLTSTLISITAFGVLFALVLIANPLLKLSRLLKPLNRAELTSIFAAMLVTAGISTFGLASQLVPLIAAPWNPEWNTPQRSWDQQLTHPENPSLNPRLYITDTQTINTFRNGVSVLDEQGRLRNPPAADDSWSSQFSYYASVWEQIPWSAWISPLSYWMIFIAASYGLFYCITTIVLGYWSDREKLIFPLAKLPESLLPDANQGYKWWPAIFSTPAIWFGFALSFFVLTWNVIVAAQWVGGVGPITLGMSPASAELLLRQTPLEGTTGGFFGLSFIIIFTAIGIAFLLPAEISFSAWFYTLVGKAMLLIGVWMGYGRKFTDFPTDWLWTNNAISAQGAGGMLLFSAISLARCLRDYARLARGKSLIDRIRLTIPVIGLAVCLATITLWLVYLNNMPFFWALLLSLFLTLITLGLMRIVAEGGIYWFQSHASFFHVYKFLGLGHWLSPAIIGPLLPIYSVMFLDLKTFLAPNLLNAAKMQKDTRADRRRFHINLALCIIITVVIALGLCIFLAHVRGARQMNGWFYTHAPQSLLDTTYRATIEPPQFDGATASWYGIGGGWVALSMFLRRTLFWFPHPIGYIMLINPLMAQLWFSFFLGWICKRLVVKYGGKTTFDKTRGLFIGLILGELLAIFFWQGMSMLSTIWPAINEFKVNIDLNRTRG